MSATGRLSSWAVVTSAAMNSRLRSRYVYVAWLALLWAIGNCVWVYLVLDGARTFRVESAAFILVGVLLPLIVWRPPPGERRAAPTRPQEGFSRVLLPLTVALWLTALVPFLTLPFLSDDYVFLASYQHWSDLLNVAHFFRPLFAAAFLLLSNVGHGSAVPFHVAGLLIHAVSASLVYVLARRLFQRADVAVLCCVMFLLNPLQLEAVLWASGLQELLWTVFVLSGLAVYTGSRLLSVWRLMGTIVLVVCGLLSKETAMAFVFLIPAADWVYFRMKRGRLLTAAYVGFAIVAAAYLLARAQVTPVESAYFVSPGKYFAKQFVGMPYRFFVQPWNLTAADIPAFVLCGAAIAVLGLLCWAVVLGAGPMALAGPVLILISTLPVYSYFYVAPDLRATRYLYFASMGWAVLVAQLLTTILSRRRSFVAALVIIIVVSFGSLQVNLRPWRTAGEIVGRLAAAIKEGSPAIGSAEWQNRYGEGLEVKDGIPTVYKGVYLFVNGYPELRNLLTDPKAKP